MRSGVLLALLVVGSGGCGPVSYDDFRGQLIAISCKRDVRCGYRGASETTTCALPDAALQMTQASTQDVNAAIKAGRMTFVSSGAQDCLDAINGAPCDAAALGERTSQRCHDVIHPNLEPGKICQGPGECTGGSCVQPTFGCPGMCMAYPPPGQLCDLSGAPERTCDPTVQYCGDPNPPDGGVPDAGSGAPTVCIRHAQDGERCQSDDQCAFGLVCLGTCMRQPHLSRGDLCTAPGTLCDDRVYCDSSGHCAAQKKLGEACDLAEACEDKLGCLGLTLGPMSVVTAAGACGPWLDVGGACTIAPMGMSLISGCPSDQGCTSSACTLTATATGKVGFDQPCDTSAACFDSLYCDGRSCQLRNDEGGDCKLTPDACIQGLTCDTTGACVNPNACR